MSDITTYADIPTSTVILASMLVNLDLLELTKNWRGIRGIYPSTWTLS
jgi:hypothetical protein